MQTADAVVENASTSSTDPTRLIGDPDILRRVAEVEYLIDEAGSVSEADAVDIQFFRKYQGMDPRTKAKLRKIIDTLDED